MSLTFIQFKGLFENAQGCTDFKSLYFKHQSSPENIIEITTNIYSVVKTEY